MDEECSQVRVYSLQGWPAYMPHQPLLRPYQEGRSHFSAVDYLLMYDDRLVIPRGMTLQILDCIHTGHLGITKCRSRAHTSVWWPGISKQTKCSASLVPKIDQRPKNHLCQPHFFLVHGKGLPLICLSGTGKSTSLSQTITPGSLKSRNSAMKHPKLLFKHSSNSSPFTAFHTADSCGEFAAKYGFVHTTSSPRYPQANGEVERPVRTAKSLLRKKMMISTVPC